MTTPTDSSPVSELQRQLAGSGALLFAIGIFTGLWTAAAMTGAVKVGIPHLALATHLNGLLGGLWIVAVAWTLPWLGFSQVGRKRVGVLVAASCYANWLVTLIASFLGVDGLQYSHDMANNWIAAMLQGLVVAPALAGSFGWAWGFFRKQP